MNNSSNEANLRILVKGLVEHSRSRLEVVFEYIKRNPDLINNSEIQKSLQQLEQSLDKVKRFGALK